MTWTNIEALARDILQEDSASFWDSADMLLHATTIIKQISHSLPLALQHDLLVRWMADVASSSTAAEDFASYDLASNFLGLSAVRYACGQYHKPRDCYICKTPKDFLARIRLTSEQERASYPLAIVWNNKLRLSPRAAEDIAEAAYTVTDGIDAWIYREPADLTVGGSPELPDVGITALIEYLISICFAKAGEADLVVLHKRRGDSILKSAGGTALSSLPGA